MEVEETKSARGNPLFRIDGFVYEVDKRVDSKFFCRCIRKRSDICPARAIILKDSALTVLKLDSEHNHESEHRDRIMRTAKERMKEAILSRPDKTCREVYNEVLEATVRELDPSQDLEELTAAFPSYDGVRSSIDRSRRSRIRPAPCNSPTTLADLTLEGEWTKTSDNEDFLLFNDGSEDRILGFSTHECMKILCEASSVYMDGSFKVVPSPFNQLYLFHAFYKGQMMPLVFFLLPEKSKGTYVRMFSLLKNYAYSAGFVFQPNKMQLDFDPVAINATQETFPAAQLKGCIFHFCQEVWRRGQQLDLAKFQGDPAVERFLKLVLALSLAPSERLDEAWSEVDNEAPGRDHAAHQAVNQFKEYFLETWLDSGSVFPRELWNHYRCFSSRSAEHIEVWHRTFNKVARKTPMNIFGMITFFKKEEERLRSQRTLLTMGLPPQTIRDKYRTLNSRLPLLVEQVETDEIPLLDYIRRVASNLPPVTVIT